MRRQFHGLQRQFRITVATQRTLKISGLRIVAELGSLLDQGNDLALRKDPDFRSSVAIDGGDEGAAGLITIDSTPVRKPQIADTLVL